MIILFQYLPDEILNIIFNYINPYNKLLLNKFFYNKYNYLIFKIIPERRYESYVRDIIRNDYNFIFKNILNNYFDNWCKIKYYNYKNIIYNTYINFLIFYSNKYNSNKCLNEINYKITGIKKTLLKNNKTKYNKWIK